MLDIGCGKGYLLAALKKNIPGLTVQGVDISQYAVQNADKSVAEYLSVGSAEKLEITDNSFDLVLSINTLHNLVLPDLFAALTKIEGIKKKNSFICVESYRNEKEKWNLMQWQLTCECFFTPAEWEWVFEKTSYSGDYEFIYFE